MNAQPIQTFAQPMPPALIQTAVITVNVTRVTGVMGLHVGMLTNAQIQLGCPRELMVLRKPRKFELLKVFGPFTRKISSIKSKRNSYHVSI